jgi:hypothetical protein
MQPNLTYRPYSCGSSSLHISDVRVSGIPTPVILKSGLKMGLKSRTFDENSPVNLAGIFRVPLLFEPSSHIIPRFSHKYQSIAHH